MIAAFTVSLLLLRPFLLRRDARIAALQEKIATQIRSAPEWTRRFQRRQPFS